METDCKLPSSILRVLTLQPISPQKVARTIQKVLKKCRRNSFRQKTRLNLCFLYLIGNTQLGRGGGPVNKSY